MTGPSLAVRRAAVDDLTEIAALDGSAFPGHGYGSWTLRQFFELSGPLCLIASQDDEPHTVGYLMGSVETGSPETVWMLALAVSPDHRRQGVARQLTEEFLRAMEATSAKLCKLTVAPDNTAAISLYESCGWTSKMLIESYFGPGEDRLLMEQLL